MDLLPKGVHRVVKRRADGSQAVYFYWRPTGARLPDPAAPVFAEALRLAQRAESDDAITGTFGALVVEYKRSSNFRDMQPQTRAAYDRALARLSGLNPVPVTDIRRKHALVLRDAMALTAPQAANQTIMVLSVLMEFAIDREYRDSNPCARITRLKGGEHERWPEAAIIYAIAHFPERFRRAVVLALYSGQREGDCCAMTWGQYDGTGIALRQQKTGEELWIPAARELRRELDDWRAEATAPTILTDTRGKPWKISSFGTVFSTFMARLAEDRPEFRGLVFHGLRKAAAAKLAEIGCSEREIMSITGHRSAAMVDLYTRQASQKVSAMAAIKRLDDYRK